MTRQIGFALDFRDHKFIPFGTMYDDINCSSYVAEELNDFYNTLVNAAWLWCENKNKTMNT